MIYQGYTTDEIKQLIPLLERLRIPHSLGAFEEGIAALDREVKQKRPVAWELQSSTDPSHYQIEIGDEVLARVTPEQFAQLEKFRIFPPTLEVPDFDVPPAKLKEAKGQVVSVYLVGGFLLVAAVFFGYVLYLYLQKKIFN